MSTTDFDSIALDGSGQGANGPGNGWYGSLLGGDPALSGTMQGQPIRAPGSGPPNTILPPMGGGGFTGGMAGGTVKPLLSQILGSIFGLQRQQPQRPVHQRPAPRPQPRPITRAPRPGLGPGPTRTPVTGGRQMSGQPVRAPIPSRGPIRSPITGGR